MRGLVILFMTSALSINLDAKDFSDGIPGQNIPKMRTGFSLQPSNTEIFNTACRSMVVTRFSENLRRADPEVVAKTLNTIQSIIPPFDFSTAGNESMESLFARMQQATAQEIKPKLISSLRYDIPEELILSSGFVAHEQSPLEMAGCYIRLGKNLRNFGLNNLASSSFLSSGALFATAALQNTSEPRVDFLLSAAQCYYWSYCNEGTSRRIETIKSLAAQYFERATTSAQLLNEEQRRTWLSKIKNEKIKFISRIG